MGERRLTAERLREMQAMEFAPYIPETSNLSAEDEASVREHFARFMAPRETCPCCDGPSWAWQWLIQHGHGECRCGYPVQVYHYFTVNGDHVRHAAGMLYWLPTELEMAIPEPKEPT